MSWFTGNLYMVFVLGCILFLGSFLRIRCVQPNWKGFWIGGILLVLTAIGAMLVIYGPPGGDTGHKEVVIPKPDVMLRSPIQLLSSPWDSEQSADWLVAETLATISEFAYLTPIEVESKYGLLGFDRITPVVAGSMIGYVMSYDDVTVIAFRGTDATEVSDWLANLNQTSTNTNHGPIHSGFHKAYHTLKPQILTILRMRPPNHLWITGHSLGGAISVVCAYDLMDSEQMEVDGLITFGQPMVARTALAGYLNRLLVGKYAHFVNNADIVPRVPPGYVHCGSMVWFTNTGLRRSRSNRPSLGANGVLEKVGEEPRFGELTPMSSLEFEQLQIDLKSGTAPKPQESGSPEVFSSASAPMIDDHSMLIYHEKVLSLVGMTSPSGVTIAPKEPNVSIP